MNVLPKRAFTLLLLCLAAPLDASLIDWDDLARPISDGAARTAPQAPASIEALAGGLRSHGDYQAILASAPALLARQQAQELRSLYALALLIDGREEEARPLLPEVAEENAGEDAEEDAKDPWAGLAEAILERDRGRLDAAQARVGRLLEQQPSLTYAFNVAATIALARGDEDAAVDYLNRAIAQEPEAALYHGNLGMIELQRGHLQQARETLARARRLSPDDCSIRVAEARTLYRLGEQEQAQQHLEHCLALQPGHTAAATTAVELAIEQRAFDQALALVERHHQALADPELLRARLALLQGDGARAQRHLAQADLAQAASTQPSLLPSLVQGSLGDWRQAVDSSARYLRQAPTDVAAQFAHQAMRVAAGQPATPPGDPDMPPALQRGGWFLTALGGGEQALAALDAADDMLAGITFSDLSDAQKQRLLNSPARRELAAALLFYSWQYDRLAARALDQAVAADPDLAVTHLLRSLVATRQQQRDVAREALDKALALAPRSYSANLLNAEYALLLGDRQAALPLLERAAAAREDAGVVFRIAFIAESLGDDGKAEQHYRRFIALEPDAYAGLNQLAWFLAERGRDLDEALRLAQRADRLQPGNASINDTIGWIHHLRGDHTLAVRYLQRAAAIPSHASPWIQFHLAQVEIALGETGRARQRLRELVAHGSDAFEFSAEAATLLSSLGG